MAQRTFGWIQNPSSVENLKNTVGILVSGSKVQEDLINNNPLLKRLRRLNLSLPT